MGVCLCVCGGGCGCIYMYVCVCVCVCVCMKTLVAITAVLSIEYSQHMINFVSLGGTPTTEPTLVPPAGMYIHVVVN